MMWVVCVCAFDVWRREPWWWLCGDLTFRDHVTTFLATFLVILRGLTVSTSPFRAFLSSPSRSIPREEKEINEEINEKAASRQTSRT
eukprot:m.342966 g.342966  ORF g.342966 m.342966 type:complete len:87 (-) comp27865_c2_seq1:146-406(-)